MQSIWPAGDQTTAFTILNCLEYEFLKVFLVKEWQKSFWKFSILSNIPDLQWFRPNKWKIHSQLSAMFTWRDGKGGTLSSQASKILYINRLERFIKRHIRNRSTNQNAGNSLFSSEIILKIQYKLSSKVVNWIEIKQFSNLRPLSLTASFWSLVMIGMSDRCAVWIKTIDIATNVLIVP